MHQSKAFPGLAGPAGQHNVRFFTTELLLASKRLQCLWRVGIDDGYSTLVPKKPLFFAHRRCDFGRRAQPSLALGIPANLPHPCTAQPLEGRAQQGEAQLQQDERVKRWLGLMARFFALSCQTHVHTSYATHVQFQDWYDVSVSTQFHIASSRNDTAHDT